MFYCDADKMLAAVSQHHKVWSFADIHYPSGVLTKYSFFKVFIRSDSWEYYDHDRRCYWSFYAPGAQYIRLQLNMFKSYDSNDRLYVYIGTSSGSYLWHYFYGDNWENGGTWDLETDMLYLYWYTNGCCDREIGWHGNVIRQGQLKNHESSLIFQYEMTE